MYLTDRVTTSFLPFAFAGSFQWHLETGFSDLPASFAVQVTGATFTDALFEMEGRRR